MRPIKFRGISAVENTYLGVKPGDFVYGDLFRDEVGQPYIRVFCEIQPDRMEPPEPVYFDIEVDPETLGQFTGLTDRAGTEIYEGDVIEVNIPHRRTQTHTGDNIPLGSYTEPLEPAIERKVGVVVFHVNSFLLIEQGWVQEFIEATAEGVNINAFESVNLEWLNDAVIPDFLWASDIDAVAAKELFNGGWGRFEWEGEEGELAFLLDELGLGSEAELIFYLQPRVLGSIHTHPELIENESK